MNQPHPVAPATLSALLVEDDEADYVLLQRMVDHDRVTVRRVDHLAAAMAELDGQPYDLVLLDLTLPDSEGLASFDALHKHYPRTPIIVLTGVADHELATTALRRGAQDYLVKGTIDSATLERSLRYAVERAAAAESLRRSEELLRHSQRLEAIGRLAGGVAHDFNNLLTVILSCSVLAQREWGDDPRGSSYLADIVTAAERAASLARQLLTFSRQQPSVQRIVSANTIIDNLQPMLDRLLRDDVTLVTRLAPDLWPTRIDPARLEQVLVNVVVNARDALPRGGRITITTRNVTLCPGDTAETPDVPPGEYVALEVSDNGVGMSPDVLARVFEPFFTTKDPTHGTGLGLAMCYGIVSQASGFCRVRSEVGRGTTFHVLLPRTEQPAEAPKAGPQTKSHGGDETVLVVDDREPVRRIAARILSELGYQVLEAGGGPQALAVAAKHPGPIHLLLTDIAMPEMRGYELARRLVAERPDTRVVYISGYAEPESPSEGGSVVAAGFVQKPFTIEQLASAVRGALDGPTARV